MRFLILLVATVAPSLAGATELSCGPAEKGAVVLDGLTDDWSDVPGSDAGGRDANLSFTVKCNVDPQALYLLVDVRDNYFVRTPAARPGEDHLQLTLGGQKLLVFPGDNQAIKAKMTWAPARPAKGIGLASALQEHGWAVELRLPLALLPGYRKGASGVPFAVEVDDCDSKAALQIERTAVVDGNLVFADAEAILDGFLQEHGLARTAIYFDKPMATGHGAGARLVFAGKLMAVISDGYVFQELPFRERRDLKDARLVDLAGDGRDALVLRYVERGGDGAREVVAVFRPQSDRFARVFAAEVGKSAGGARVDAKVSFVRRGKATDLLLESGGASGFSQANYHESPADDMIPVLLPWGDERRARYQFVGDEYRRAP